MDHRIIGTTLPVLEVTLQPGDMIIAEPGELSWISANVQMKTTPMTAGAKSVLGMLKRAVVWEGAAHPYVRVHHPGTKANDYRNKAADAAIPKIAAVVRAAGLKVAKGVEL